MDDWVRVLDRDECLRRLDAERFGRLAFSVAGVPEITPVNYRLHEGRIVFRTAEGGKLFGVTVNAHVAFEVDGVGSDLAWSVIGHGTATRLQRQADIDRAAALDLQPWVPTVKHHFVEIDLDELTGREFRLGLPDRPE